MIYLLEDRNNNYLVLDTKANMSSGHWFRTAIEALISFVYTASITDSWSNVNHDYIITRYKAHLAVPSSTNLLEAYPELFI